MFLEPPDPINMAKWGQSIPLGHSYAYLIQTESPKPIIVEISVNFWTIFGGQFLESPDPKIFLTCYRALNLAILINFICEFVGGFCGHTQKNIYI